MWLCFFCIFMFNWLLIITMFLSEIPARLCKPDVTTIIFYLFFCHVKGAAGWRLKREDVACQCNLPATRTRTVGTQLSERKLIYRRSVGECLSNHHSCPCVPIFHIHNLLLCMWITGVQKRLPTSWVIVGKEETEPEKSAGRLISVSEISPPSSVIEIPLPEIEDDDQGVTVVSQLLSEIFLWWRNRVLVSTKCCSNVEQRIWAVSCWAG